LLQVTATSYGMRIVPSKNGTISIRCARHAMKRKSMEVQTVLFDRTKWTRAKAKKWLLQHRFEAPRADIYRGYFHFRQLSPNLFDHGSFRTKRFGANDGILAVMGHLA
jgi:hypothetical protein